MLRKFGAFSNLGGMDTLYGGLERPKPQLHTDLEIQNLKNIFLTKDLIMIEIL